MFLRCWENNAPTSSFCQVYNSDGFNLCSFDLDRVSPQEPEIVCDACNLALSESKSLAPHFRTYERIIDGLLQTLMGAKYLASTERTEKWEVAIPMLDDAIELAQAEMVSIRVSPILKLQPVDLTKAA